MNREWSFFKHCPLCQRDGFIRRYHLDSVHVFQCPSCHLRFLNPHLSSQSMLEVYSGEKSMRAARQCLSEYFEHQEGSRTEKFQHSILDLMSKIRPPGDLLDVGCGRGHFLGLARRKGWRVWGIEPAQEHADHGRINQSLEIVTSKWEEADFGDQRFDAITLWDVIEHVPYPREILARVSHWLKKNGVVLIATPNHKSLLNFIAEGIFICSGGWIQKPISFFYVPEHILYFTPSTLRRLMTECGFRVIKEIKTGTDIDRYQVAWTVKMTAKLLIPLARLLRAENRVVLIGERA